MKKSYQKIFDRVEKELEQLIQVKEPLADFATALAEGKNQIDDWFALQTAATQEDLDRESRR